MASETPAPRPHNTLWVAVNSFWPPVICELRASKAPNLLTLLNYKKNKIKQWIQ